MVFIWSLGDKQVSLNFLDSSQYSGRFQQCCIWMVSAHPSISNSFSPFTELLGIVISAPITSFSCYRTFFVIWQDSSIRLSLFFLFSLIFNSIDRLNGRIYFSAGSLFLLTISKSGLLVGIRYYIVIYELFPWVEIGFHWSPTDSKSHRSWMLLSISVFWVSSPK